MIFPKLEILTPCFLNDLPITANDFQWIFILLPLIIRVTRDEPVTGSTLVTLSKHENPPLKIGFGLFVFA